MLLARLPACVAVDSVFIQLLDDDIVSLTALMLIALRVKIVSIYRKLFFCFHTFYHFTYMYSVMLR